MNILLAGDSRCACPPRPNSWPHIFGNMIREQYKDVNIYKLFAVEDIHIYTMFLLEESLNNVPDKFFDHIIIHSGWHDYMESWPLPVLESLVPKGIKEECLIDDSSLWVSSYTPAVKEYKYLDKPELIRINDLMKQKSKNQLYIGMHGIRDGSDLHKKEYIAHHYDILESNNFFSELGDFLNQPQHYSWAVKSTTHDRIHYNNEANHLLASNIVKHILSKDLTIDYLLQNSLTDNFIMANDEKLSGREFYHKCETAGAYVSQFTKEGDKVVIDGGTSIDQISSFLGCILCKRIPLIIETSSKKITEDAFNSKMEHILETVAPTLCLSDTKDYKQFTTVPFGHIDSEVVKYDTSPNDVAFCQLSSGTTGKPKIVEVTHSKLISNCIDYSEFHKFMPSSVMVSWLPLYHDMGLVACFLAPLLYGSSIVHINPFDWIVNPQILLDKIKEHKGTHCYLPNFALNYMVNRCEKQSLDTMTNIVCCSEPTSKHYLDIFNEHFNVSTSVCYALAENIFAVSQTKNEPTTSNGFVSCGEILPGVSVLIVKDGEDVTENEIGGIFIKSNYSERGDYYGYYDTGDIGFVENGELFVVGRTHDKIISFGNNVYPEQIEETVSNVCGIINGRVACFGVFDEDLGTERVYVCAEGAEDLTHEVQETIQNTYNISPIVYIVNDIITKTSSGKISRARTKDKLIEHLRDSSVNS